MCSAAEVRPAWGLASSSRDRGEGTSMACRRSRGQPFDSNRHTVVCHSAAVSPLPCTKTMGGASDRLGPLVAQPAMATVAAAAVASRRDRRCSQNLLFMKVSPTRKNARGSVNPRAWHASVTWVRQFASGKHACGVLHAGGHFAQMVQRVAKGHFQLGELLEIVAHDVLVRHADAAMQLHGL